MNPSREGFALEEIIYNASTQIPDLQSLRENEIKQHFGDPSLNGVDHWIKHGQTHIFIQDKWKESTNQHEASQFIVCADRIMSRLPPEQTKFLIWASKKEPTANSLKSLKERNVIIVCSSLNIESLAKNVMLQVCSCLKVDSTKALQSIQPTEEKPAQLTYILSIIEYDRTEEGLRKIEEMKALISSIQLQIIKKIEHAQNMDGSPETYSLVELHFPKTDIHWTKLTKIDYNQFLKAVKPFCYPTKSKKIPSRLLFYYVKLRKVSALFAKSAIEYETKRKELVKKSTWAKTLPQLKCCAEQMEEEEYKACVAFCEDYYVNTLFSGTPKKIPNQTLISAFHSHRCSV